MDSVAPIAVPPHSFGHPFDWQEPDSASAADAVGDNSFMRWADDGVELGREMARRRQTYMIGHPARVRYNVKWLPEPPKQYRAVIDPSKATITVEEVNVERKNLVDEVHDAGIERRNWLHTFNGSLQFSQAYISPNWYQGGNNNLNMIANVIYSVKLNQAFHPDLLFENTIQYKLGLNSAPDDSIRSYSISEDLLQINSKFGVKAAKKWFYSVALTFKTQLFDGYKSNTRDLKAAFLSPGELNIGLGMTYNHASAKKTFTFDASISPLSYNLKTCINSRMDETDYGIKAGRKTVSEYGSSAEAKMTWKITRNITYTGRWFVFSDYSYLQGDWENTFNFSVNRYISTQIYVHARYDSSTTRDPDSKWHLWQLKEILSFGFAYQFSTI
jgi:hypothetical protein